MDVYVLFYFLLFLHAAFVRNKSIMMTMIRGHNLGQNSKQENTLNITADMRWFENRLKIRDFLEHNI